ncbi:ATP-dependent DNA helicase Q4-like isoform X2 [Stegodyphus dumicola]|uniref:ATP-dependent DNA helicase Q4-like isoform X2 n=1 Tax=Stegodyphus dumicola TaxID=202533 RepID=UPI0015AD2D04|nr:ATP-dependent DNA helicase Q4-like isoform X2 [Stegodyphus dumicola]
MEQNNELEKLKVEIKTWEQDFLKRNLRKPGKDDIKNASKNIKDAYRNYWKLRNEKSEAIQLLKDDVWSYKLNKSKLKTSRVKASDSATNKICDKIRRKSSTLNFKAVSSVHQKKEISQNGNHIDLNNADPLDEKGSSELTEINSDLEYKADSVTKKNLMICYDAPKQVKSINILSPAINLNSSKRTLHFNQEIDREWFERCLNNSNKVLSQENSSGEEEEKILSVFRNISTDVPLHVEKNEMCTYSECKAPKDEISNSQNNESAPCSEKEKQTDFATSDDVISCSFIRSKEMDLKIENNVNNGQNCMPRNENGILDDLSQTLNNGHNKDCGKDIKIKISKKRKLKKEHSEDFPVLKKSKQTAHLEKKMSSGTVNENFVRLNIKKKKFSRGHHSVNIKKLKWKKWKQMKKDLGSSESFSQAHGDCFKCGQSGHWARQCPSNKSSVETVFEEEDIDVPLPTLQEAAALAKGIKPDTFGSKTIKIFETSVLQTPSTSDGCNLVTDEIKNAFPANIENSDPLNCESVDICGKTVKPLYDTTNDGKIIDTPEEVFEVLYEMGYEEFRQGQETAVMRVLSGLSTLVVLPTGSGKSLCYQLPAYMYAKHYKCLSLVISPLVSLMEDQVAGLPQCLHAVCIHSGMSETQKAKSMQDIKDGLAHILLISPEAVLSSFQHSGSFLSSNLPPISFACIDEVHCLSQWSHNFRPSYLQLYKVLTQNIGVKCILGLTATATHSAIEDIISQLDLKCADDSVVGYSNVPFNLHLSVSRDKDKDKALLQLLNGDRFHKCSSIIIYCIRRVETERLAALIRTCMQDDLLPEGEQAIMSKAKKKKRCFRWTAEAYHAGLPPQRRRSIQKQFMSGKLRVVVATVAFGMGLDKRDVRAVIHYNMPKSYESYVQEIGRAGRDGLDSQCHLFLDSEGNDLFEQQRHIYSNSTDRNVIRKLLRKVFVPCKCHSLNEELNRNSGHEHEERAKKACPKHEIAFSMNDTVQELDMKEENISTLLCYLELHPKHWIEILPPTYATCTVRCYGGPKQMHSLALKNPAIATAFALDKQSGKNWDKTSQYQFSVVKVASFMGWNAASLKRELKHLEWNDQKHKTGVLVEFSGLAFHIRAPGNLTEEELDSILDFLYQKVTYREKREMHNLKSLFSLFEKYSVPHYWACCEDPNDEHSKGIKETINKYFESNQTNEELECVDMNSEEMIPEVEMSDVRAQIRDIICTNNDQNFTGRAIARIFHGISSPCFPSEVWGKVRKFWRCLLRVNFNTILKAANEELRYLK